MKELGASVFHHSFAFIDVEIGILVKTKVSEAGASEEF
jgi:hypothetical protein